VIRMAAKAATCAWPAVWGLNALLVSALENRSGYPERVCAASVAGNAGTAIGAVLETWHGAVPPGTARDARYPLPRPLLHRARNQAGLENCKLRFRYMLTMDELIEPPWRS